MASWGGFTDEEVRRLKGEVPGNDRSRQIAGRKKAVSSKQGLQGRRAPQNSRPGAGQLQPVVEGKDELPPEQRLSAPKVKSQTNRARVQSDTEIPSKEAASEVQKMPSQAESQPKKEKLHETNNEIPPASETKDDVKPNEGPKELNEEQIIIKEKCTMEKFQQQQKQMEELNKQKRIILATAIKQRKKKAVAEASKLNKLHKELDKLDELLTEDVSKIRDRIEDISRDYLEAQKRYERAEREFIASKIDLHEKEELKESLTEHLYTVIHHNEIRKSKKLAEMMEQLDIEEVAELANMPLTLPELPVFNHSVIRSPKSPTSSDPPLQSHVQSEDGAEKTNQENQSGSAEKSASDTSKEINDKDAQTIEQSVTNSDELDASSNETKPSVKDEIIAVNNEPHEEKVTGGNQSNSDKVQSLSKEIQESGNVAGVECKC